MKQGHDEAGPRRLLVRVKIKVVYEAARAARPMRGRLLLERTVPLGSRPSPGQDPRMCKALGYNRRHPDASCGALWPCTVG
jgi:hypothetical protein